MDHCAVITMNPIIDMVDSEGSGTTAYAYLENAVYSGGHLSLKVTVKGGGTKHNEIQLYKNGELVEHEGSDLVWTKGARRNYLWIAMSEPANGDLYEIEISYFAQRLSFTMDACSDYLDLLNIGTTVIKNDISITATAGRVENNLTVWCYPVNPTGDKISGIGEAAPSIWDRQAYIKTESGFTSVYSASGERIIERFFFDMPSVDTSATLHIPYITMVRCEKRPVGAV